MSPGESIFLDSSVTSLRWIRGYMISNCNTKELFISSSNLDQSGGLACRWRTDNNFMLADLSIQNVSNEKLKVQVVLTGVSAGN